MVDAKGKCSKCKKKTVVFNPGLICQECGKVYHGGCMIPPVEINELKELARSKWKCKKCFRDDERQQLKNKAVIEESKEIKRQMDIIIEIKELLVLSEMALDRLNEKHENLIRSNQYLQQENLVLSRRLAHLDGTQRLKVEFLSHMTNKKPLTKAEYLENALKLAQKGKTKDQEEDVTKDFSTFAKFAGLNKGEIAAFEMQGRLKRYSKTWGTHLLLFIFLIVYTCLGGLIFHLIEGHHRPEAPQNKSLLAEQYTPIITRQIDNFRHHIMTAEESKDFQKEEFDVLRDFENGVRKRLNYEAKEQRGEDEMNWGFMSSVFFCSTVYTTIGYGHMTPVTPLGQIVVILYATVGVPLFLITLADFGGDVSKETQPEEEDFQLPITFALVVQFSYIFIGALFFNYGEQWSYSDSFYFTFESVATIGYGDFVPRNYVYMMPAMFYLLFGLAISSMTINVVREKIIQTVDKASAKLGHTLEMYVEDIEFEKKD